MRRSFRFDGGAEASMQNFIAGYTAAGADVTLICEHWDGSVPCGLRLRSISLSGSRAKKFSEFKRRVEEILLRENFDIVQAHEFVRYASIVRLGDGLHSTYLERMKSLQKSWMFNFYLKLSNFHKVKVHAERQCLSDPHVKLVVVNSEMVRREVSLTYPSVASKIALVRNTIKPSFFCNESKVKLPQRYANESRLLFVGSGWGRKNVLACIDAMSKLPGFFSLWIIGYDKNESRYRAYCRQLGLAERVIFLGCREVSKSIYTEFDGLLLPSIYDPFPNVACEALVSGLPIFVSTATGASDYRGSVGVNVFDDVTSLVRQLVAFDFACNTPDSEFFENEFAMRNVTEFVASVLNND